jgi:hypothetical protein
MPYTKPISRRLKQTPGLRPKEREAIGSLLIELPR